MGARVVVDLQAVQSRDFGERGIGRYVAEMARAVEAAAPGRVHAYTLSPRTTAPGAVEPLVATGRVRWLRPRDVDDLSRGPLVFHATCPFEMRSTLDELWPPAVRRRDAALAVTLYDLIPLREPGRYLADPADRVRYTARLQLVRAADLVLAISERSGRDAVELLGIPPERIRVIGGGASAAFRPPPPRVRRSPAPCAASCPSCARASCCAPGASTRARTWRGSSTPTGCSRPPCAGPTSSCWPATPGPRTRTASWPGPATRAPPARCT